MTKFIPASKYCSKVFDGTHDTPKPAEVGHLLITSKNIVGGRLNLQGAYYISDPDYRAVQKRSAVKQWDVLFSMIGSIGEIYLEDDTDINYAIKNVGVFSCEDEYSAKWLYYYLKSPYARQYISNYLSGAVQKFLGLGTLREFPVLPYDKSKKLVVDILSAIDNKIELNDKISSELEQVAKTLYDYWFVQFDFPDHNGTPYKSSGGIMQYNDDLKRKIPKDWLVKKIGSTFNTSLGGTPSTENADYWDGDITWINSGEVDMFPVTTSEKKITNSGLSNSAAKLLKKHSVVVSIVRHLRASILAIEASTSQSVVGIEENESIRFPYIYLSVQRDIPRLMSIRTGAQQPHINKEQIDDSLIIIPDKESIEAFNDFSIPIFQQIETIAFENQKLVELRDWLLPMLMNGQVKVTQ